MKVRKHSNDLFMALNCYSYSQIDEQIHYTKGIKTHTYEIYVETHTILLYPHSPQRNHTNTDKHWLLCQLFSTPPTSFGHRQRVNGKNQQQNKSKNMVTTKTTETPANVSA